MECHEHGLWPTLLNQETGGFVRGFRAYDSSARTSESEPGGGIAMPGRPVPRASWRRTLSDGTCCYGDALRTALVRWHSCSTSFPDSHWRKMPSRVVASRCASTVAKRALMDRRCRGRAVPGEALGTPGRTDARIRVSRGDPTGGVHTTTFDLAGVTLAAYGDVGVDLAPDVELVASARVERNSYDYENHHLVGNTLSRRRDAVRLWRLLVHASRGSRTTPTRMSRVDWASNGRRDPARWSTRSPDSVSVRHRPRSYTACRAGRRSPTWTASVCGLLRRAPAGRWQHWTSMSPSTSRPRGT